MMPGRSPGTTTIHPATRTGLCVRPMARPTAPSKTHLPARAKELPGSTTLDRSSATTPIRPMSFTGSCAEPTVRPQHSDRRPPRCQRYRRIWDQRRRAGRRLVLRFVRQTPWVPVLSRRLDLHSDRRSPRGQRHRSLRGQCRGTGWRCLLRFVRRNARVRASGRRLDLHHRRRSPRRQGFLRFRDNTAWAGGSYYDTAGTTTALMAYPWFPVTAVGSRQAAPTTSRAAIPAS